jgi:hypothetical protein
VYALLEVITIYIISYRYYNTIEIHRYVVISRYNLVLFFSSENVFNGSTKIKYDACIYVLRKLIVLYPGSLLYAPTLGHRGEIYACILKAHSLQ